MHLRNYCMEEAGSYCPSRVILNTNCYKETSLSLAVSLVIMSSCQEEMNINQDIFRTAVFTPISLMGNV